MAVTETKNIITGALTQALEKMAFLEAVCSEEQPEVPSVVVTADIDFAGPISGTIRTAAGIDFARMLAENISGLDELTEAQCIDAMQELVNVTCGLVLPMIAYDRADVFDVTVPHLTRSEDRLQWEDFISQDDVTILDVEGCPVATRLIVKLQQPG